MKQTNGTVEVNIIKEIDDIIHNELLPIQDRFRSYLILINSPSFRLGDKQITKCIKNCNDLIDIARRLTLYERDTK